VLRAAGQGVIQNLDVSRVGLGLVMMVRVHVDDHRQPPEAGGNASEERRAESLEVKYLDPVSLDDPEKVEESQRVGGVAP